VIFRKLFFKFLCVCLSLEKEVNKNIFSSKRKIWLDFQESVFLKNLGGKQFSKVVENLEIFYLSNLVFILLIVTYFI